jgi:hypothetical protein
MITRIAIDPGVNGGITYIDTDGSVHALPMPETLGDLCATLKILCKTPAVAYIEELPKWQGKMSASAMGTMFENYGQVWGVLKTLETRVISIKPQAWQKALSLGNKKDHGDDWKRHLKSKAQELYPKHHITLKTADAFLILEASIRMYPNH